MSLTPRSMTAERHVAAPPAGAVLHSTAPVLLTATHNMLVGQDMPVRAGFADPCAPAAPTDRHARSATNAHQNPLSARGAARKRSARGPNPAHTVIPRTVQPVSDAMTDVPHRQATATVDPTTE
ncbi:MAG: hypothetical protein ACLP8S_34455, partial [Solirubrobacteraceae bacterium]